MLSYRFASKLIYQLNKDMKNLKNIFLLASFVGFVACSEEEPVIEYVTVTETVTETVVETVEVEAPSYVIDSDITEDTTLDASVIWTLKGRIFVKDGATLTIPAGTIIKAAGGTGTNASVLVVAQGASIQANGTAAKPIIMTSVADDIEVGELAGSNLDENVRGLWGGLIVLGKAHVHGDDPAGAETQQIEGIPADVAEGLYGGSDDADSSGSITYLSVRHGGALIGADNEINGITFGGVGSGTTVDNIEVVGNVDDGVEFFGGSVNATNIIVWGQGDDAVDLDQAYDGTLDNVMVIQEAAGDHALEIDGPKAGADVNKPFTIKNLTIIGNSGNSKNAIADFRDGANGTIENVLVYGLTSSSNVELDKAADVTRFNDGELVFKSWEVVVPEGATLDGIFVNDVDDSTFQNGFATSISSSDVATVGAENVFSWSYYGQKN